MPDITCPVCGTANPASRTFCLKCAADLHAPVPDATSAMPTPKVDVPIQPLLIGGGVALAAIALIAILVVFLGGTPAATIAPSLGASSGPTAAATDAGATSSAGPTTAATAAPASEAPPPTQAPPATPNITAIPAPAIRSFTGPRTVDCTDQAFDGFITLTWEVSDADSTTLSIDGPGVYERYPGVAGNYEVPFGCGAGQHTYTLTTVGGNGAPASKTLTITEG